MTMLSVRFFLVFVIFMPLQSWSQQFQSAETTKEKTVSVEAARATEDMRVSLLKEHIAWQWAVAAKVSRRTGEPVLGVFVGMKGQMTPEAFSPSGLSQTLAWLTTDGNIIWSSSFLQKSDGTELYRFRAANGEWIEDPYGQKGFKALHDVLGVEAYYEDLHNWLTGIPGGSYWPSKFARSANGIYPIKSSIPQGEIQWSEWMEVETERKQKMPMPGTWNLYAERAKVEFALVNFEGYVADALPNPGWPYLSGKKDDFLQAEEKPIASDNELDYKSW